MLRFAPLCSGALENRRITTCTFFHVLTDLLTSLRDVCESRLDRDSASTCQQRRGSAQTWAQELQFVNQGLAALEQRMLT
jgi:hypothetical protein